jgi:hypothetical protein
MAKRSAKWNNLEEFLEAVPTLQRFPIDSKDFYNERYHTYSSRMMITPRMGEFGETISGLYTMEEVYKVYMESTTEYEAAKKLFSDWRHWEFFVKDSCNAKYINEWRMEREARERLRLKQLLWKSAENGNVAAQKLLLDLSIKDDSKAVTPEGKALEKQLEQTAAEKEAVQAIKQSLQLVSVNGKRKKV